MHGPSKSVKSFPLTFPWMSGTYILTFSEVNHTFFFSLEKEFPDQRKIIQGSSIKRALLLLVYDLCVFIFF
jgi:hypothetical protein